MGQHGLRMVAVGARIGQHIDLQRRELAVPRGAHADRDAHRVARGGGGELLGAREFQHDGTAEAQGGQAHDVLDQHLLLAAEPAAHPGAQHPDPVRRQAEQVRQALPHQERHLRAAPHH